MRSFYRDTVTRWRAAEVPGIHGGTRDWVNAVAAPLTSVRVQPTGDGTHRLLGAYDLDILATDRISRPALAGGLEWFEVAGDPQRHRSPYGSAAHTETALRGIAHE